MESPELIWRFGQWIARRESGAARLVWSAGEAVLRIHNGKVVSFEGPDSSVVAQRLGCQPLGHRDLLEEARALAARGGPTETQAVGTAKEILQQSIHAWMLDPQRRLELVEGEPDLPEGPTISISHAVVELVLSDVEHSVYMTVLPEPGIILRRSTSFLQLYPPLRLSEEADLIVSKVSGQRPAEEVASSSTHGPQEVLRLLAALVASGMLEPMPLATPLQREAFLPDAESEKTSTRRRLPITWLVVAVVAIAGALAAVTYLVGRARVATAVEGGAWTIVVDMGCEPNDLERILKRSQEKPNLVRAVRVQDAGGFECWRLVWGQFPSREKAEKKLTDIPNSLRLQAPPAGAGRDAASWRRTSWLSRWRAAPSHQPPFRLPSTWPRWFRAGSPAHWCCRQGRAAASCC